MSARAENEKFGLFLPGRWQWAKFDGVGSLAVPGSSAGEWVEALRDVVHDVSAGTEGAVYVPEVEVGEPAPPVIVVTIQPAWEGSDLGDVSPVEFSDVARGLYEADREENAIDVLFSSRDRLVFREPLPDLIAGPLVYGVRRYWVLERASGRFGLIQTWATQSDLETGLDAACDEIALGSHWYQTIRVHMDELNHLG